MDNRVSYKGIIQACPQDIQDCQDCPERETCKAFINKGLCDHTDMPGKPVYMDDDGVTIRCSFCGSKVDEKSTPFENKPLGNNLKQQEL